jgi:transcriptional regulator with XRE-family HTH domain
MAIRNRNARLSPLDHDPAAVKAKREAAGLTQAAFARVLGMSRSYLCEIEKGTRNAAPALLNRMATALGCPVEELARRTGRAPRRKPNGAAA